MSVLSKTAKTMCKSEDSKTDWKETLWPRCDDFALQERATKTDNINQVTNMLHSIFKTTGYEWKHVLERTCCEDVRMVCLQYVVNKMCFDLCAMALAACGISAALNSTDLPGKISEELLVCKICFGRFHQNKLPKLLACSHTFCEPCVKQYHFINTNGLIDLSASDGGVQGPCSDYYTNFPCPVCRKVTQLPEAGVEGLANNFTVLSLMEILVDKRKSLVDNVRDNSDACSVKSDVTGVALRDRRKRRRRERRGSFCSVFSVPAETTCSLTSLLGIPSIDARCSICDRRFPESEFPCGHCVCTKCFVTAQRNNHETDFNKAKATEDEVNDAPTCPACVQHKQSAHEWLSNEASSLCVNNESADGGAGDQNNHGRIVNECRQQSNSSTNTARNMEDPSHRIYPSLPVDSRSPAMNCTCNQGMYGSGGLLNINPGERPPPYNPDLYLNSSGPVDQHSLNPSSCSGSRNGSPRRSQPSHRYSASVVADIQHDSQPCCTAPGLSSLAFSNPTYACSKTHSAPGKLSAMDGNLPPPHAPDRPLPQPARRQSSDVETYNTSQCSGHTYECASNASHHSYESPYTLRRTQSVRPPVPPRRHSAYTGRSSVVALRQRLQAKQRSESAPSAPSAPGSEKLNDSEAYRSRSALYGVTPPVPPPRRIFNSPLSSPVRCLQTFGRYSEVRMESSAFRRPTKVAQSAEGDLVVVDEQQMTVQVFTYDGKYLSLFKVIGVQGASFFSSDKLAVATHRGISIFTMSGELIKELSVGLSVNTFPYKFGFVVCTPKTIQIYRPSLTLYKEISKRKTTKTYLLGKLGKKQPDPNLFENIRDIAVLSNKQIAVLDSGKGTIHVIDEEGTSKMTINPALESCGSLADAESLTTDRDNNFYVADTGNQRVLRFTNHGTFSRTLISWKNNPSDKKLFPHGVAITDIGRLVVSLAGEKYAEVRIYSIPWAFLHCFSRTAMAPKNPTFSLPFCCSEV